MFIGKLSIKIISISSASLQLVPLISFNSFYFIFQTPLTPDDDLELSSEDEAVASDLDMHALILGGLHQDTEPLKTAEEVIQEIDDMMQEEILERISDSRDSLIETNETMEKAKEVLSSPLYEDSKFSINSLYIRILTFFSVCFS